MEEITLISSDKKEFRAIGPGPVPLYSINAFTLQKVLMWCNHHHDLNLDETDYVDMWKKKMECRQWESYFFDENVQVILNLIRAADYLEINPLFELSCQKIAHISKDYPLQLTTLPDHYQSQITTNISPWRLKRAAEAGMIFMTPEQRLHNNIWTSVFKNDEFCDLALAHGANPILIGKDLECHGEMYLVLSSMDFSGDTYATLKERGSRFVDCLQEHHLDRTTAECTLKKSKITLNISESRGQDCSIVRNVEQRLVRHEPGLKRWTSYISLRYPTIHRLENDNGQDGRVEILCEDCLHPVIGEELKWLCLDSLETGYQETACFESSSKNSIMTPYGDL